MATVLALFGDEVSLFTLQDILEAFGHTLVPASTSQEALDFAQKGQFDLILIDIHLDEMNPVALVQELLALQPRSRVVAITAHPKAPLSLAMLEAGAQGLMKKPFEVGGVLQLLEAAHS